MTLPGVLRKSAAFRRSHVLENKYDYTNYISLLGIFKLKDVL